MRNWTDEGDEWNSPGKGRWRPDNALPTLPRTDSSGVGAMPVLRPVHIGGRCPAQSKALVDRHGGDPVFVRSLPVDPQLRRHHERRTP